MQLQDFSLQHSQKDLGDLSQTADWTLSVVPLASPGDFEINTYSTYGGRAAGEEVAYYNAATCPDCSAGMIRQGRCCVCPSCGFESCLH